MQVLFLYAATVLIWGSTWVAIAFQLGEVAPEVSLVYRFGLASLTLLLYAAVTRTSVRLPLRHYPFVVLQAGFLFCINYALIYNGTFYVTSGLVAVLFTSLIFMNAVLERLFFGTRIGVPLVISAFLGIAGIGLIFWPELQELDATGNRLKGVLLVLAGTFVAALGNMAAIRNTGNGLPVLALNVHCCALGAVLLALFALVRGLPFNFEWTASYVLSLLHLAIPGTALAFGFYLALLNKIGSARAAYITVLIPIVALAISTVFEEYTWSIASALGVVLALGGNAIALSSMSRRGRGSASRDSARPARENRG